MIHPNMGRAMPKRENGSFVRGIWSIGALPKRNENQEESSHCDSDIEDVDITLTPSHQISPLVSSQQASASIGVGTNADDSGEPDAVLPSVIPHLPASLNPMK